jgi:hypothetical protein
MTMSKNVVEPEGPQMSSQYAAYAFHAGYARLHARTSIDTPTRQGMARTRGCTHTQICNIYCFSPATMIRERCSVLHYTYVVCHVFDILLGVSR